MTQDILKNAIEKLEKIKKEINDKIKTYEEEIISYKNSNKELIDDMSIEVYNPEIDKAMANLKNCETYKSYINDMQYGFNKQRGLIKDVLNFNLNFSNIDDFFTLVLDIDGYNVNELYDFCTKLSKQTMVKVPLKTSELQNFNTLRGVALLKADTIKDENIFFGNDLRNKETVAIEIKKIFNSPEVDALFDKMSKYFENCLKVVDKIAKESGEKIQNIRKQEIKNRKEEINSNIKELENKIEESKESLVSIESIYELYEEYNETQDRDLLIRLIGQLTDFAIIGQRESKLITYQPTEKEEKSEEKKPEETVKEVKEPTIAIAERKIDDPLYFKKPDTQNIICFLGKDNDDIFSDIIDHFDYSNRPYIISELISLFNILYNNADYENKTGGNPKYFSSSKVRSYREKLGFNYKRFGVSQAQYRIHAITRDSKLLKDLGYGTGRITFFGALGVNDDKEKTGAYDRIARRGIQLLTNPVKLQPNFDYIEHISNSYVPVELLSEADKNRLHYGMFNGMVKGTDTKKAIENFKYMYYEILDDESKAKTKKWLDEYFMRQSEKLFEFINEYNANEKKKKGTLD